MRITSVRFRLMLWNIGVLTVVLLGFQLFAYLTIRTRLLAGLDRRLAEMSIRTVDFIVHPPKKLPTPPPDDGPRSEDHRMQNMIRAFDLDGKVLKHPGPPVTTTTFWDSAAFAQAARGRTIYSFVRDVDDNALMRILSRPVLRDGKQIGVVQVAAYFEDMQTLLTSLMTIFYFLVPCALLLAAVGGVFLTDRALRPVRHIIHSAETISSDDLSRRLPVSGADEFAHLATTMNGMLGRIERSFAELSLALERERRLTSDASHELRTPLTAITANASLALNSNATLAEYRESMQAIDAAAKIMRRLIEDLLLLARSDSGQLMPDHAVIDTPELFDLACSMVQQHERHTAIQTAIADDALTLFGDPIHLQRVLVNLLDNALRYSPPDGKITLEAARSPEGVNISVSDTGCGIPPECLPHLGERFYRVESARSRHDGGTGLGLAICQGIVEAHGGQLVIHSSPASGTRVDITLPDVAQ